MLLLLLCDVDDDAVVVAAVGGVAAAGPYQLHRLSPCGSAMAMNAVNPPCWGAK
jgi:hypothetical protein